MQAPLTRREVLGLGAWSALAAATEAHDSPVDEHRGWSSPGELPRATWVVAENERPGTVAWALGPGPPSGALEGFCDTTSATFGDVVTFYVHAIRRFRIDAYRMGYYQGRGARLITTSRPLRAQAQPAPEVIESLGTVECRWNPTWQVRIERGTFPPGCYLFRLVSDTGWKQWIPLTIRDDASRAAFVFMNSVTTWQAYNPWGGWSLYAGPTGRADVVSFDRPYALGLGQSNFLFNELPVLFDMERLGLDLHYWTDVDFHVRGQSLVDHRCLISLGHDEYWSWQMRAAAVHAMRSGVNLAFLGSNFCYRAIRLEPSVLGSNRLQVNYRSTSDPIYATDPKLTTVNWSDPPLDMPESQFSGSLYDGFAAPGTAWDMVAVDPEAWFWSGTGVREGTRLPGLEQNEYNHFDATSPLAPHVQLLGHSPVPGTGQFSDATYVALPGEGGVFCSGTSTWALAMSDGTAVPSSVMRHRVPGVTGRVLGAMSNLYRVFGTGPAGASHPSHSNTAAYYG